MNDVRFALRILGRNRGSTALIVSLLALGTGASTTIFSLFDAVLLRPLPVRQPEQLVRMVQWFPKPLGMRSEFPYVYYKALRDHSKTLGSVFAETVWDNHFRMTEPEPAEEITVYGVTPEFFDALGVRPLVGRLLMTDDGTRNFDSPPAVLSYNFWRKRFGGNSSSVRGTFAINGHRFSIVGVMPRGFHGLSVDSGPDVRIPLRAYSLLISDFNVDQAEFELAGRLKPGVTQSQAQAECLTIWRPIMKDYYQKTENRSPETVSALLKHGMEIQSLEHGTSILRDNFGDVFKLLMASVSVLVVIVALNVAGLLLARAAARQREMAVRLAIGASLCKLREYEVSPAAIARESLYCSIVSLSAVTLLLVRHADIDCSSNGLALLCGSHDAPLSPKGRLQLEPLRRKLATEQNVCALYSSPLRRAVETARAAPPELLTSLRLVSSLGEIHCGAVEGLPLEDVRQNYPEYWRRNEAQADESFCWPGGETYRRFRRRVLRAVRMLARMHAGKKILMVTHAGVINQILGTIAGQSAARWENFRPGNASITELNWHGDTGEVLRFDDRA